MLKFADITKRSRSSAGYPECSGLTFTKWMYYTYILQSFKDNSFYIGYTSNLRIRLDFHNSGSSKYTAKKIPWKIVYYEVFDNKTEAVRREKFLKKQKNKDFYNRLVNSFKEP